MHSRAARAAQPGRGRPGRLRAARLGRGASTSPATPTCSTRWARWAPVDVALLPIWGWGPTLGEGHLDPTTAARATELHPTRHRRARPLGHVQPDRRPAPALARHAGRAVPRRAGRGRRRGRAARPGAGRIARRRCRSADATPTWTGDRDEPTGRSSAPAAQRPTCCRSLGAASSSSSPTALALWLLAAVLDDFDIDRPADALARRARRRPPQRRRVAAAGVRRRADLGADARARRHRDRRPARRRWCSTSCPASTLSGFWTPLVVVVGLAAVSAARVVAAGARRRRLVRPPHGRSAPGAGARAPPPTDVPGIVFVQIDGLAEAVLRRALRSGDAPTIDRWLRDGIAPPGRVGDRLVVADRRQPVRHPPRLDGRDARVPLGRQGDRRGRRLEPPGVGRGDRAGPLRRPRPARPPRLQLRQPVLRRRRAGRADDERHRPAQGGPPRRRLRRLLLPAPAGDPDAAPRRRRHRPRAAGGACCSAAGTSSRGSTGAGPTPCCGRSRRSSAATSPCRACSTTWPRDGPPSTSISSATTRSPTTPGPSGPTRWPCCATSTARSAASPARSSGRRGPYHLVVLSDHGQTQGAPFHAAGRRDAGRARRPAVRRGRLGRRRCRDAAGPSRAPGCATPGRRRARPTPDREPADVPDRARLGQPRAGHAARTAPPADQGRDRRALPGAARRAGRATRTSASCSWRRRRGRSCSGRPGSATWRPVRSSATTRWRRSGRAPSSRCARSTPTRRPPT